MGQKAGHSLTESSDQGLTRLQSKCGSGLRSHLGLNKGKICFWANMVLGSGPSLVGCSPEDAHFLLPVGQRLPSVPWHIGLPNTVTSSTLGREFSSKIDVTIVCGITTEVTSLPHLCCIYFRSQTLSREGITQGVRTRGWGHWDRPQSLSAPEGLIHLIHSRLLS